MIKPTKLSEAMRRGRVSRKYIGGCWYPTRPILAAITGAKLGSIDPDTCGWEEAREMLAKRWPQEFAQTYACPKCGRSFDLYNLLEHLTSQEHDHEFSRRKVVSILEQLGL
ncbi:MAG TPA: hypothetical protein VJ302_18435 [Blastocatellia bacterium]|nr:hypothetical protein [Blastocatellia bacterium]